ncbi:MAG: Serine/threonine-protein kinase PknB [Pelotomaculum sp. PtaU1.Bin035]|nr:MAG: Serine/threonine-protein kinase PknB [Pelotomaculum sp. PtaU1.Bin035]
MPDCLLCGIQNPDDLTYCHKCGGKLGGATGRLSPSTVLDNRYTIVKTLGQGGMGAVYLAFDRRLNNKPVVVKEMSANAVGQGNLQAAIEAFKKEASLLIDLRHQALPVVTDFFSRGEDRWYLVMDYIEGITLKAFVQRRGPIPQSEVLDLARQLCDILDYLHKRKPPVIFRDLKPDNIMLTPGGIIKLIDFGIARHFKAGVTKDTTAYGSTGFAPPEQYGQNQTDARSDIYSLGATLHYLLTGIDPGNKPFVFEPLDHIKGTDPKLVSAIMRALELDPGNRPGSAGEMLALLSAGKDKPCEVAEASATREDANGMTEDPLVPKAAVFYTAEIPAAELDRPESAAKEKAPLPKIVAVFVCVGLVLTGWFRYVHLKGVGEKIIEQPLQAAQVVENASIIDNQAGGAANETDASRKGEGDIAGPGEGGSDYTPLNHWNIRNSPFRSKALRSVSYGNGIFTAVGLDGVMLTSTDGVDWKGGDFIANVGINSALWGLTYGNGVFVAVGGNGVIITSSDGVEWKKGNSGTFHDLRGVAYGNGLFVAVGKEILTSPDGITWTVRVSRTSDDLNGVSYGNGTYLAVGLRGAVLTSPDAINWTTRDPGVSGDLSGAACGKGIMLLLGDNGSLLTSTDGINWISRHSRTGCHLRFAAYSSGTFVVAGDVGTILTSTDGVNWTVRPSGTYGARCGVAYGNGTFVVVGYDDPIIQSDPV